MALLAVESVMVTPGVSTVTAVDALTSTVGAVMSNVVPELISRWPFAEAKISSPPPTSWNFNFVVSRGASSSSEES